MGYIAVYALFALSCVAGLLRPWVGLVAFYSCVLLEPNWNWRWSVPSDFPFQKYIALCVVVGYILSGFEGRKLSARASAAISCFVGFLAISFASSYRSIAPELSAFYMDSIWKIVVMAVLAVLLIDEPRKLWVLLVSLVISQGYSAYQINEQYFADGFSLYASRSWGYKGDNNLYSNLTVPLIACSASVCVFSAQKWLRYVCGGIFLLQIHQIMLCESRGAMISTVLMLVVVLFYMPKNSFTIRAASVGIVVGALLAGPPVVREFMSSFVAEEELDSSASSRFKIWKAGWDITWDYPLLGVGPYAGQALVPAYYEGGLKTSRKGLHNLLFEITTGMGVPAAILYFSFFLIPWYQSWLRVRECPSFEGGNWVAASNLAVTAGIPGYLCSSMFSSGALSESSYALAAIGLSAASIYDSHRNSADLQQQSTQ